MLRGLFDMNNPVMRFLSRVTDLVILNLLVLLFSIPIVTIGAARTALYYVLIKMKDEEEGYITSRFFKSFKENLKQSTALWLILFAVALLLGTEWLLFKDQPGQMASILRVAVLVGLALWYMITVYVFALQSRFYNTVKNTLMNGILLMFANAPKSLAMLAAMVAMLLITFTTRSTVVFWNLLLYWILCGFSVAAWINVQLLYPTIQRLMPPEEKEETAPDNAFVVDEEADLTALGYDRAQSAESAAVSAPSEEKVSSKGATSQDSAPSL